MATLKVGTQAKAISGGLGAQGVDGKIVTVVSKETANRYYDYRQNGALGMYCGKLPNETNTFVRQDSNDRVWGLGENHSLEEIKPEPKAKKGGKK
jgi:hypothetical protein